MPKKGPDSSKIKRIIEVLKRSPDGLWIREIARKADLDKSTVSLYIGRYLQDRVETVFPRSSGRGLTKVVRLRE